MSVVHPYTRATSFLRQLDNDWARHIDATGPCLHDPKAAREPYEALVRAIACQQLTAKAGDAIVNRLRESFSPAAFPSPAEIVEAPFETIRACGFSRQKIATVRGVAAGALSGVVPSRAEADALSDTELIARLVTIKGIGRWTVEMLLMYALERPDVLPADDFGVREGYRILKSSSVSPTPRELRTISEAWSPYRTVASWYLWRVPRVRKLAGATESQPIDRPDS